MTNKGTNKEETHSIIMLPSGVKWQRQAENSKGTNRGKSKKQTKVTTTKTG